MRSAIYHRRPGGTVLALLVRAGLASTPALAADEPIAEAWVGISGPEDLARVESVGLTVAEGHRALPDGGWEQRVLARPAALDALIARGFTVRVERADHRRGAPRGGYRPPDVGDALLVDLAARSSRAGVVGLGLSEEGRPIRGLWIGLPPESGAPTWRVLGAHHGDEWSSFEVALAVAEALVDGDGEQPEIIALLDGATVWVVPYVNPDGVVAGSRYNANGVDLNRNYDVEWSPFSWGSGDEPFSESETRAVRALAAWSPPLASLSLHAGAENIGYPWNFSYDPTPEEALLADVAESYAALVDTEGFYATNGADWYVTRGDTNDWSYARYGGMDFTVEISDDKSPPDDDLAIYVAKHRDAALSFLTGTPALVGRVVDADTHEPVEAFLDLDRANAAPVALSTHPGGSFHRLASAGPITLEAWAPGYARTSIEWTIGGSGALEVPLRPVPLGADAPSPRAVSGRTEVTLPGGGDGFVRLVRPAHADVVLPLSGGRFTVDPTGIAPGPWSIVRADDLAWPRALFVVASGPARIETVEGSGAGLVVTGEGFAEGTRAWALVGPRRTWLSLPIVSEEPLAIGVDARDVPEGNADLVLVSNGTWLGVPDAFSEDPDTAVDTGDASSGPRLVRGSCGCATPASSPYSLLPLALLAAWSRRRST